MTMPRGTPMTMEAGMAMVDIIIITRRPLLGGPSR
jgi:hypothetical protein